jgi:hypothetical protein
MDEKQSGENESNENGVYGLPSDAYDSILSVDVSPIIKGYKNEY